MMSKNELKDLIPYGKYKEVAAKAGVSSSAVTKFFDGRTKESHRIQIAAMAIAIEVQGEIAGLQKQLNKLI